ncbi:MAG: HEPN domain-containing protein [Chloroflexi bacterium]|nr:HEPN domain-containing protein [Chloroflexota bacterium]
MPHDPARIAETQAWFIKAANDLRAAEHLLGARPPLLGDTVFHCQQAVEKSLKGFLAWYDIPFRKTHSLEEIGEQCLRIDPTLKALVDRTAHFAEYAWKFRHETTAIGILRLAGVTNIAAALRRNAAHPQEALALVGITPPSPG